MTKAKYLILFIMVAVLILVFPGVSNAATEYTYSDTEQGIEWGYRLDDSNNVIELKCKTTSKTGAVTIPSIIDEKTVISLADADNSWDSGAFEGCAGITEVTIPNTISVIGRSAFKNCTGLKTITLPDSVTKINDTAFQGCSGITSITLSSNLSTIGDSAFDGCVGIKSITIPNSVTSLGTSAFNDCRGLIDVQLSESLSKIAGGCFRDCTGLKTIILPNSVTTIEYGGYSGNYGAFYGCTKLEKILIPDSVASIDNKVFEDCDKLTIYGNDGQVSKEYAEANDINFKYISEWDDSNVGDDITAPVVEKIQVTSDCLNGVEEDDGMFMLPTGTRIVINVYFNEALHGDTAPTLTIRCGQGSNIELTDGTISATHIVYTYTIKEGDIGIISAVDIKGGNITDAAGNAATLTVKDLTIENWWNSDKYLYANGIVSNPESGNNSNENNDNKPSTNGDKGTGTGTTTDGNKNDNTQATGKIPHAGVEIGIAIMMLMVVVAGVVIYTRYRKMKDIL